MVEWYLRALTLGQVQVAERPDDTPSISYMMLNSGPGSCVDLNFRQDRSHDKDTQDAEVQVGL